MVLLTNYGRSNRAVIASFALHFVQNDSLLPIGQIQFTNDIELRHRHGFEFGSKVFWVGLLDALEDIFFSVGQWSLVFVFEFPHMSHPIGQVELRGGTPHILA